jgi:hypothetical protein
MYHVDHCILYNVLRLFLRICKNSNEITILLSKYLYLCILMFDFFFTDNYIGYFKKTSREKLLKEFSVPLNSLIILISTKIIWNSYIILSMNLISINPFYKWIDRHSLSKNNEKKNIIYLTFFLYEFRTRSIIQYH